MVYTITAGKETTASAGGSVLWEALISFAGKCLFNACGFARVVLA